MSAFLLAELGGTRVGGPGRLEHRLIHVPSLVGRSHSRFRLHLLGFQFLRELVFEGGQLVAVLVSSRTLVVRDGAVIDTPVLTYGSVLSLLHDSTVVVGGGSVAMVTGEGSVHRFLHQVAPPSSALGRSAWWLGGTGFTRELLFLGQG